MKSEVIETRTAKVWLDEDGICKVITYQGVDINLGDIKEINRYMKRLAGGGKIPVFNDIRGVNSVSREARMFTAGEDASNVSKAAALLIDSPVSRVIGNFFLGINKPPYPTKLFTSETDAVEWLKGFLES